MIGSTSELNKNIWTSRIGLLIMNFYIFLIHILLISYSFTIENDKQCLTRDFCSNSVLKSPSVYYDEKFIQSRNCFCDSYCQQYGDCCDQKTLLNSNDYECVDFLSPTMNEEVSLFSPLSVWMRTKCLSIYVGSRSDINCRNLNQQTFKDNPLLFIPVTSIRTNITYRNYYCLYCNNEANLNIQTWEYEVNCPVDKNNLNRMILDTKEQVNYYIHNVTRNCRKTITYPRIKGTDQPSVFIRPCKKSLPPVCPVGTPNDLARNCSLSGTAYRYNVHSNIIYHNPYCAECSKMNDTKITCLDPTFRSSIFPIYQKRISSLSILFDPNLLEDYLNINSNNNSKNQMIYSLSHKCKKSNELYNVFLNKCNSITNLSREIIISMKCSYPIQASEGYIQFDNGSLYLRNQSILLNRDQYAFIHDRQVIFCADQWKQNRPKFSFYRNIVTVICTSISLICLVIFAIAFGLIPSLHNLPGKCLLILSISIFIGQSTFIITSNLTRYSSLCSMSGILIHYFYLSSFFWLLIISIHIHSTFNCEIIRKREKIHRERYLFLVYNILVWCSTALIILIAYLIQFVNPQSSFSPNYGYVFCSISKANAMILFFLLPVGCILLFIGILFIKTIVAIHHSQKIGRLASASSSLPNHAYIFIYARLASLMGLQWILLIVALILQRTWSWIIFEIINSVPGVFICVGFLCSKKLWKNFKQRTITKLVARRQSSKSNTATTTTTTLMSSQLQR